MWNQRYDTEEYLYGTEPNDFLVEQVDQLPKGKILCLADGEGRNSVWLAQQGYDVTAVDSSDVGLAKGQKLAESRGVEITTIHADLAEFEIEPGQWDGIVSIFCHVNPDIRADLHKRCIAGLVNPGGVMLLEVYTPEQLEYKTGGPPKLEKLVDPQTLRSELDGLEFLHFEEVKREIHEGKLHNGIGAVVQVVARKI